MEREGRFQEFSDQLVANYPELFDDGSELGMAYYKYAAECKAAMKQSLVRLENLCDEIDREGDRNPFDRVESRIKTLKSAKEKCLKKGCPLNDEGVREAVKDVAGIRIITKYLDEIYSVKEMIERIPGISIVKTKDYVKDPKPNGYQGVHLDCQVEIYSIYKGSKIVPVEIQIRSKSMNLWATLEHDLKYKNENPSPRVEGKFRQLADILRHYEDEAIELRDYDGTEPDDSEESNTP